MPNTTTIIVGQWRVTLRPPVLVYRGANDEHITRPNLCRFGDALGVIMQTTFDSHCTERDNRHVAVSYDAGASWKLVAKNVDIGSFSLFSKTDGEAVTMPHDSIRFGATLCSFGGTRAAVRLQGDRLVINHDKTVASLPKEIMAYWTDRSTGEASDDIAPAGKPLAFFWGTIVQLRDGRWVCPGYCSFADEPRLETGHSETAMIGLGKFSCFLLVSDDEGHSWQWLCTVATPRDVPSECCEGAGEEQFYELADRWRVVFRTGALHTATPLYVTDSFDGGRSWSKPQPLTTVAGHMDPRGLVLPDGTVVLATGRPGADIYLADGVNLDFHKVDIVAHHNVCLPEAPLNTNALWDLPWFFPNSSHTDILPLGPNRLLFTYDRIPDGWRSRHTGFTAPDEVYTVVLDVEKK